MWAETMMLLFQIFIGTVLKFHFHALYSDSQKFILQLVFLKLHLVLKTDHVFELFIMFKIMLRVMFSRQILFSVFVMVNHVDIWNPFMTCGIYVQRIPQMFFFFCYFSSVPSVPYSCTALCLQAKSSRMKNGAVWMAPVQMRTSW